MLFEYIGKIEKIITFKLLVQVQSTFISESAYTLQFQLEQYYNNHRGLGTNLNTLTLK